MLALSHPEREGLFQGSKWLKFPILCNAKELQELFASLPDALLYRLTGFSDGSPIPHARFLEQWEAWISALQEGKVPSQEALQTLLTAVMTPDSEDLWLQEVPGRGYLLRVKKPLLHLQTHFFTYSSLDHSFHSMSWGSESIFWGLQFSWPQVYQDPKTGELCEVGPNPLFECVRQWIRDVSRPTPFLVEGKKLVSTIRLGRNCFPWISRHPQLLLKDLSIEGAR
ncbi:MAG: hypothetical protein KGI80_03080 [Verrucomicrobiota bacterium]|nr:hypothetical protein [Verrucomicrobiota bacterium]